MTKAKKARSTEPVTAEGRKRSTTILMSTIGQMTARKMTQYLRDCLVRDKIDPTKDMTVRFAEDGSQFEITQVAE